MICCYYRFVALAILFSNNCYVYADDSCWEEIPGYSLYGYNDKVLEVSGGPGECKEACIEEEEFYCSSFDYQEQRGICFLSAESALTVPAMFAEHATSSYFERTGSNCSQEPVVDSGEAGPCKDGWYLYHDQCLWTTRLPSITFDTARSYCQDLGADLAVEDSQDMTEFIFSEMGSVDNMFFPGIRKSDGIWMTLDHKPLTWTNWRTSQGEPRGDGSCVMIYAIIGDWNDIPCSHIDDLDIICSIPVN